MKKRTASPIPNLHTSPICIVGTIVHNRANFTTIGDIAVAGIKPALIMISINANHGCMEYINTRKSFSINIPNVNMLREVDYAGIHSGKNVDKSSLFDVEYIDQVPTVKHAPITLIVKESKRIEIEHRVIIVCEVLKTYLCEEMLLNGIHGGASVQTILYGLDNNYYSTGQIIGKGYYEGKSVK
jgi:flavin reductase (DIM6/NTAB) family NADH-FMN oxidoreductase RutF